MTARTAWKSSDPIQMTDDRMSAELKEIDVLANVEVSNARVLFHDQMSRENPTKADVTARMNGVAELFLE